MTFLQESFLINDDKMYISGWWIFRADADIRRKVLCILIWTDWNVTITTLMRDAYRRYLKLRVKEFSMQTSLTFDCIYLEPDANLDESYNPCHFLKLKLYYEI